MTTGPSSAPSSAQGAGQGRSHKAGADLPQGEVQAGASGADSSPAVVAGTSSATPVGSLRAGAAVPGQTSPGSAGNAVTSQVFPQVTRLVSRGDGTHRLTLRLHPADLGEVKVVLTVRDNTVDVTLAAGSRAREALRDGSPQLRALLELTGATTGHVVIRDLSSGAVSFATASNAATRGGQQHPSGNGSGHPTHQGAPDDAASAGRGGFTGQPDGHRGDPAGGTGGGPASGQAGARGDGTGTGPDRSSRTGLAGGPAGPHARAGTLDPPPPPVGYRSPSRLDLDL